MWNKKTKKTHDIEIFSPKIKQLCKFFKHFEDKPFLKYSANERLSWIQMFGKQMFQELKINHVNLNSHVLQRTWATYRFNLHSSDNVNSVELMQDDLALGHSLVVHNKTYVNP